MNQLRAFAVLLIASAIYPRGARAQDQYGQPQQGYQDPNQAYQQQPQQGYDPNQGPNQGPAPDGQQGNEMQYGYFGPHPEPYDVSNVPCQQQGAHFHPYPPFDRYLFREANGYFYFVGDMGDFGYAGQQWGYQANHPIPLQYGGGFCYFDWPHRHPFPPPPSLAFNLVGGYYAYAGPWDPAYYTYRSQWNAYFGSYYRNNYFGGRYWSVRPAAIYRPVYGWGARGVYRPGMNVYAPGGGRIVVSHNYVYGNGGHYYGGGGGHYYGGGAPNNGGGHYVGGGAPNNGGGHYVGGVAPNNGGAHYTGGGPSSYNGGAHYAAPARAEPVRAEPVRSAPVRAEPVRSAPMRETRHH